MTEIYFDPKIWGPHYWFFLMSLGLSYPSKANETTKKKYYEFISNLPLFIPHPSIGNKFSTLLDKFPVSPYLEGKDSFLKWIHFIHNKVNTELGKEEKTLKESLDEYYEFYKPKDVKLRDELKYKKTLILLIIIVVFLLLGYYLYKN